MEADQIDTQGGRFSLSDSAGLLLKLDLKVQGQSPRSGPSREEGQEELPGVWLRRESLSGWEEEEFW